MAKGFTYAATASQCPGALNTQPGWYSGTTLIATSYINPATGLGYTPQELTTLSGAGTPAADGATAAPVAGTPAGGSTGYPAGWTMPEPTSPEAEGTPSYSVETGIYTNPQYDFEGTMEEWNKLLGKPEGWTPTTPTTPTTPLTTPATMPTFDPSAISGPPVSPAPAYEKDPSQIAFEETVGGIVTDWVTSGGYGIPKETQALMIQKQTDTLKAREQEAIRVMRNNMERRGITNSGYVQANENMIHSNTSVAIAGAIADVQIKSALMKMASFEKAMGAAAQFLGYLSEQSQLQYKPEFATWQAEQMAKLQAWQASFDVYKMAINQAYQQQNITLQADLTQSLQDDQQAADLQLAEMKLEAELQAAKAQGAGQFIGGLFQLAAASF